MIITNFETGERGAFQTWIEVYDLLVHKILELPESATDFKWKVQEVMFNNGLERDSLDGVRYVFATVGAEFLGINFEETDKVFQEVMKAVDMKEGEQTIEALDDCLTFEFIRSVVPWRLVDCKQISYSTTSLLS